MIQSVKNTLTMGYYPEFRRRKMIALLRISEKAYIIPARNNIADTIPAPTVPIAAPIIKKNLFL